jgi:hypothetical protein
VDGVGGEYWTVPANTVSPQDLIYYTSNSSTTWLGGPFMSDEGDLLRRLVLETCEQQDLMKRLPGCRPNWPWFATLKAHDIHLLKRASYRVDKGTRPKRASPRRVSGFPPVRPMQASCRKWMTGRPRRS